MTNKPSDITAANQTLNPDADGKTPPGPKRPKDARTVTEANEAANAQFNDAETGESVIVTRAGVIGGSPD